MKKLALAIVALMAFGISAGNTEQQKKVTPLPTPAMGLLSPCCEKCLSDLRNNVTDQYCSTHYPNRPIACVSAAIHVFEPCGNKCNPVCPTN